MLYYITTILLHRPFRNNNECRSICRQASAEVEHLLLLLERCMGLTHVTYIMAYCAYTGATVAMLELYDGVEGSQARVNTFLRALYCVRTSCPGIQRSIDIIIKGLEHVPHAPSSTIGCFPLTPFATTVSMSKTRHRLLSCDGEGLRGSRGLSERGKFGAASVHCSPFARHIPQFFGMYTQIYLAAERAFSSSSSNSPTIPHSLLHFAIRTALCFQSLVAK